MFDAIRDVENNMYNVYGIYFDRNDLKIGDAKVDFDKDSNILITEDTYPAARGLFELLFKRKPQLYTEEHLEEYKKMLVATNAQKKQLRFRTSKDQFRFQICR